MADKTEKSEEKAVARRSPATIPKVFESKDPEAVQATIRNVYGVTLPLPMVNDLMAFVAKAKRGDYRE